MFRNIILVDNAKPDFDLHNLNEMGNPINIRDKLVSPFVIGKFENRLMSALSELKFNPDLDAIALIGRQTQVTIAVATLAMKYGNLNLVVFAGSESRYVTRRLSMEHTGEQSRQAS